MPAFTQHGIRVYFAACQARLGLCLPAQPLPCALGNRFVRLRTRRALARARAVGGRETR